MANFGQGLAQGFQSTFGSSVARSSAQTESEKRRREAGKIRQEDIERADRIRAENQKALRIAQQRTLSNSLAQMLLERGQTDDARKALEFATQPDQNFLETIEKPSDSALKAKALQKALGLPEEERSALDEETLGKVKEFEGFDESQRKSAISQLDRKAKETQQIEQFKKLPDFNLELSDEIKKEKKLDRMVKMLPSLLQLQRLKLELKRGGGTGIKTALDTFKALGTRLDNLNKQKQPLIEQLTRLQSTLAASPEEDRPAVNEQIEQAKQQIAEFDKSNGVDRLNTVIRESGDKIALAGLGIDMSQFDKEQGIGLITSKEQADEVFDKFMQENSEQQLAEAKKDITAKFPKLTGQEKDVAVQKQMFANALGILSTRYPEILKFNPGIKDFIESTKGEEGKKTSVGSAIKSVFDVLFKTSSTSPFPTGGSVPLGSVF